MKPSLMKIRALSLILRAARRLFVEWRVVVVMAAVYASLLAALFLFISTKEATLAQVILTLLFAALVPALFFLLQAMIVNYARGTTGAFKLLRRSFADSRRLALASIPLALLALLCFYVLNKLQSSYGVDTHTVRSVQETTTRQEIMMRTRLSGTNSTETREWPFLLLATLRLMIFGFVLPLCAARLWSAAIGHGLLPALKKLPHHLGRALGRDAVLVYAIGFMLFGLVPYFLLFMRTSAPNVRVEFGLFVARLALVFIFTLGGWVLTLAALEDAGSTKAVEEMKTTGAASGELSGEAA